MLSAWRPAGEETRRSIDASIPSIAVLAGLNANGIVARTPLERCQWGVVRSPFD